MAIDSKWRTIACPNCAGCGMTMRYESIDECRDCGGGGSLFIRPGGHLFLYPGGPAAGMWDESAYARGVPYPQFEKETNDDQG